MAAIILEGLLFAVLVFAYRMTQGAQTWIALVSAITIFVVSVPILYLWDRKKIRKQEQQTRIQEKPGTMQLKSTSGSYRKGTGTKSHKKKH